MSEKKFSDYRNIANKVYRLEIQKTGPGPQDGFTILHAVEGNELKTLEAQGLDVSKLEGIDDCIPPHYTDPKAPVPKMNVEALMQLIQNLPTTPKNP